MSKTEQYVSKEYEEWVEFCESESSRLVYDVIGHNPNNNVKDEKKFSESLSIAIFKDLLRRYKRSCINK